MKEFTFPLSFQDLERPQSYSYTNYNVRIQTYREVKDASQNNILKQIKVINDAVYSDINQIQFPRNFDFVYFVIKGFSESIQFKSIKILEEVSQCIEHMLAQALKKVQKIQNTENIQSLRITFKMIIFLAFFLLTNSVVKKKQGDIIADALNKQSNRNKKNKRNVAQIESKIVIQNQKKILKKVRKTLDIDFVILWQRNQVDQQFFKYYTDVAISLLESTIAKDPEIRQIIFLIFQIILKNKPQIFKQIQIKLVNLIYDGEFIDNLVIFFSKAQTAELQNLCRQTTILTVTFLTQKPNSQNSQSSSIKNTKQFLSKLSQLIPKTFYNNLSCYIRLYDNQSYLLRNAISDILANIIRKVLTSNQNQQNNKTKQKYIQTLLQRIYDKNSHCRGHVLGILAQLSQQNIIPKNLIINLLKAGIDRLKDHSVNTRKRAIQLISNILKIYHFLFCKDGQKFRSISQIDKQIDILNEQQEELKKQLQTHKQNQVNAVDSQTLEQIIKQIKIDSKKLNQNKNLKQCYKQQKQVLQSINNMIQTISILLNSKNFSDVVQVIKLFIFLKQVGIQNIQKSMEKIRMLIFSKQKQVKEEVLNCFVSLYLQKNINQSVKNLIQLFTQASLQDQTCLQQILQILINQGQKKKQEFIPKQIYELIWSKFIDSIKRNQKQQNKRAPLKILRIFFSADQNLLKQNYYVTLLEILKKYVQTKMPDYVIVTEIAKIVKKCGNKLSKQLKSFVLALMYIILNGQGTLQTQWYAASQQVLSMIYTVSEQPQKYSQKIIMQMHSKLTPKPSQSSLSQFLYILSHSCLKLLIHMDNLQNKLKKIKQNIQNQSNKQRQQQLDKVMGGLQRQFQLKFEKLEKLVQGVIEDPFIAYWLKIIEEIVEKIQNGGELQRIAVLALCKFMCISEQYCKQKLPLLFKTLTKSNMDYVIKNNIIIAIGDLLHRFHNQVEPHKKYLYQNLHDPNPRVRKATMTVLNHLILNDMIRIKSQICDIALLFQDDNIELQNLVKQFFNQLNKKDAKLIYNQLPEVITRLSNIKEGLFGKKITEKSFESFAKNIIGMLQKDKYSQNLIQKLCQRFNISLNILQLRNTAYCLSQLNINEKGLRKILQNFQIIRQKLSDNQILGNFRNLLIKLKKNHKAELKSLLQQFQAKLSNFNDQIFNLENAKKKTQKMGKNNKKKQKKGQKKQRREDKMQEQQQQNNGENTLKRRTTRQKKQNNNFIVIQSSQNSQQSQDSYSQQYSN